LLLGLGFFLCLLGFFLLLGLGFFLCLLLFGFGCRELLGELLLLGLRLRQLGGHRLAFCVVCRGLLRCDVLVRGSLFATAEEGEGAASEQEHTRRSSDHQTLTLARGGQLG